MTLLDRVKNLCTEYSITLAKLEKTLNFGNGTLSRWDDSSPSGEKLYKVAGYFSVTVDYLLGNVNYLKIGLRIRNKRNVRKISIQEMSERLNISTKEYTDIEKGEEAPLRIYGDICNILNMALDELFSLQLEINFYSSDEDSNNKKQNKTDPIYVNSGNQGMRKIDTEARNKTLFIEMCDIIGLKCAEYSYKNIPGFVVNNKGKRLFITRDNAYLLLENAKDFFFMKISNTLCYSDELFDDNNLLNAAHAEGNPSEEEIKNAEDIMDNDKNWD